MKLKVGREAIQNGLQKVQAAVPARTTIPVLGNVLFVAEENRLFLTASDLELSVRASVEAEVQKPGAFTLPAKMVFPIFRSSAGSDVEIEVSERGSAIVKSGSAVFTLNGISADDYPPLPAMDNARVFSIDQGILRAMLQRTGYAASADEARPVLNGVLLSFKDGRLTAVATDGRRLALVEQELEFSKDSAVDLVVPSKAVNEVVRALGDEGAMKIMATANQVAFDTGDVAVYSKLVEGTYPNYRQVIPTQCEQRITVERENVMNAVRRVALLTSEQSNSVKMTFGKNRVEISAATPDVGEAKETVPVKYSGKELVVSFNPEFLLDPLKNLVTDQVYFELNDSISPGVVKTDDPFLYVIMPMRMS